jgi:hypothetical protein
MTASPDRSLRPVGPPRILGWTPNDQETTVLTTAATKLIDIHEDGTLRDPDPQRRATRLRDAGVRIERRGPLDHVVRSETSELVHFRTMGAAERHAHAIAHARRGR